MNIYEIRSAIFYFPKNFLCRITMYILCTVTLQNCNHITYHKILKKTNFKEIPIGLNC